VIEVGPVGILLLLGIQERRGVLWSSKLRFDMGLFGNSMNAWGMAYLFSWRVMFSEVKVSLVIWMTSGVSYSYSQLRVTGKCVMQPQSRVKASILGHRGMFLVCRLIFLFG